MKEPILAIDIGSTKICALIGDTDLSIFGHGISKSFGIKKGMISNIDLASSSIRKAYSDAKMISGYNPTAAIISISGSSIRSIHSTGVINLPNKEITPLEIDRVMQAAFYNANIPAEFEIIHGFPYRFKIDEQNYIENPDGMHASRVEVSLHILITNKSNLINIRKAVTMANIEVIDIVYSGYSSLLSVKNESNISQGVAVIDIGGQTSNVAIHADNGIQYNDFIPVGSDNITQDLSIALNISLDSADEIKLKYGSLFLSNSDNSIINVPNISNNSELIELELTTIQDIIYARVEESLRLLSESLTRSNIPFREVILTGGFTNLPGVRELMQEFFLNTPISIRSPKTNLKEINQPEFSTSVGLLLFKAEQELSSDSKTTYIENDITDIKLIETSLPIKIKKSEHENNLFMDLSNEKTEKKGFIEWLSSIF